MPDGEDNPTTANQLGDALWRAGRLADAKDAWLDAEQYLRDRIRVYQEDPSRGPGSPALVRSQELLRAVRRKIRDAEQGRSVEIAPIAPPAQDNTDAGETTAAEQ